MADTKISGLTALAAADVETNADSLAIVDDSATATKKITVDNLRTSMGPKLDTELALTSGATKDFSPPAWAKRITIPIVGMSTNGTSIPIVQLGDSGGVEATGYTNSITALTSVVSSEVGSTAGFNLSTAAHTASRAYSGKIVLELEDSSNNVWVADVRMSEDSVARVIVGTGNKALSGALTTVRLTTVNGTDAFDGGAANAVYE